MDICLSKDYWTIKEPFIDFLQQVFLKFLVFLGFLMFCQSIFNLTISLLHLYFKFFWDEE